MAGEHDACARRIQIEAQRGPGDGCHLRMRVEGPVVQSRVFRVAFLGKDIWSQDPPTEQAVLHSYFCEVDSKVARQRDDACLVCTTARRLPYVRPDFRSSGPTSVRLARHLVHTVAGEHVGQAFGLLLLDDSRGDGAATTDRRDTWHCQPERSGY